MHCGAEVLSFKGPNLKPDPSISFGVGNRVPEHKYWRIRVGHWLDGNGWSWTATARFLHLAPRTLRHWRQRYASASDRPAVLGRPTARSTREQRNEVIHL